MFSLGHPFPYLIAYLAILYIRPHEYVRWLIGVPLPIIFLGLSFLFWLGQKGRRLDSPQHRLVPTLFFFIVFSVMLTGWMGGAIKAFTDFLPTAVLFFMLSTTIDSLPRLRVLFMLIATAGAVMAVHGIKQAGTEDGIGWTGAEMIEGRITYLGFLNDPNDLAMALLMGLPLALYLAYTAGGFIMRQAWRVTAGLAVYGVYLTNSRGGVLSLGAMLMMYGMLRYGVWRGILALPLLGTALVLFAPSRGGEISANEESAAGRVEAWFEGFQMLRSHPLFGVGYNQFVEHHIRTAHNSFVLAVAELGILGYFVWFSNLVLSVAMLVQIERLRAPVPGMAPEDLQRWQALQLASRALLYGTVGAVVASMFLSRSYTVIWYIQFGMIVAVYQLARLQWPSIEPITFGKYWGRLFSASLASVVFFWLLTRILL